MTCSRRVSEARRGPLARPAGGSHDPAAGGASARDRSAGRHPRGRNLSACRRLRLAPCAAGAGMHACLSHGPAAFTRRRYGESTPVCRACAAARHARGPQSHQSVVESIRRPWP